MIGVFTGDALTRHHAKDAPYFLKPQETPIAHKIYKCNFLSRKKITIAALHPWTYITSMERAPNAST